MLFFAGNLQRVKFLLRRNPGTPTMSRSKKTAGRSPLVEPPSDYEIIVILKSPPCHNLTYITICQSINANIGSSGCRPTSLASDGGQPGNALKRCCLADARLGPLSPKTSPATASMPKSRTFRAASRATDHLRYLGRLVVKQQRGAGYAALMTLAVGVGLAVP